MLDPFRTWRAHGDPPSPRRSSAPRDPGRASISSHTAGGAPASGRPMHANPADDAVRQLALSLAKAVVRARNHDTRERPGPDCVLTKGFDQLLRGAIQILVAAADDGGHGRPHRSERRPPGPRPIVREHVLVA